MPEETSALPRGSKWRLTAVSTSPPARESIAAHASRERPTIARSADTGSSSSSAIALAREGVSMAFCRADDI